MVQEENWEEEVCNTWNYKSLFGLSGRPPLWCRNQELYSQIPLNWNNRREGPHLHHHPEANCVFEVSFQVNRSLAYMDLLDAGAQFSVIPGLVKRPWMPSDLGGFRW